MTSTLLLLAGLVLLSVLGTAVALWLGAVWRKIPGVTAARALAAGALAGTLPALVQIGGLFLGPADPVGRVVLAALAVASILLAWLIIRVVFRTTWRRALGAWLVTVVPVLGVTALLILVVRPYALEPFIVPSHSMAPTLLGPHRTAACPEGDGTASVGWVTRTRQDPSFWWRGICDQSRRVVDVNELSEEIHPPDRFLANKLLTPRRWDVVVFLAPWGSSEVLTKRVVGLPGEEVRVRGGAVWLNGERLEPPPELAGLRYEEFGEEFLGVAGGRARRPRGVPPPVRLGPDEYYVLGDFSEQSVDSRQFGPVPRANLIGVATLIYWPPGRIGRLR